MSAHAALSGLASGLELALESVRKLIASTDQDEWIDQRSSPLGRRRHCELARTGALEGARKVDGKWLVRRRILDEYIDAHGGGPKPTDTTGADDDAAILEFKAPIRRGRKR